MSCAIYNVHFTQDRTRPSENDNVTEIILSRLHLEVRDKLGRPVARDVDVLLAISAKENTIS